MHRRLILGALALVSVLGAGYYFTRSEPLAPFAVNAQTSGTVDKSRVLEMAIGAAEAPVTVIEYASFTCPHCASFHAGQYQELKRDYIDTGKVRFVIREVYFDRFGLWAGMVARCGGPERYFGIVDLLFERQRQWLGDGDPVKIAQNLRIIGKTAGLSEPQLDACLSDSAMAEAMVAVFEENRDRDQVEGTPSFMIDGQKYSNMSYEELAKILDEKLAN